MFTPESVSNFGDLLQSVERLVIENSQSNQILKDLNDLEIGVDRKPTKYPYLIVYPVSETLKRLYTSNGYADVDRIIQFEVKVFKDSQEAAFGQANGIINNIKTLFTKRRNSEIWRVKNQYGNKIVFNTKVEDISPEDPELVLDGLHLSAKINITFTGQIKINEFSVIDGDRNLYESSSLKEIVKITYEILNRYKDTVLSPIKTFKYGIIKAIHVIPALVVTANDAVIDNKYAGSDTYRTDLSVVVYSNLYGGVNNIYENLRLIDVTRKILFANKYFLNRGLDYNLNLIEYGVVEKGENLYFASRLNFQVWSYDSY